MATVKTSAMTPSELKVVFESLNIAPSYLSKRFILRELLGWSDELITTNANFRNEEEQAQKTGNKVGAFR